MPTRILAGLMIPGRGDPVRDACVTFDGSSIAYAGTAAGAPPSEPGVEVVRAEVVMPGMWDCHCHFLGLRTANIAGIYLDSLPLRSARAVKDAEIALQIGKDWPRIKKAPAAGGSGSSSRTRRGSASSPR